jgi:hypothetical protein
MVCIAVALPVVAENPKSYPFGKVISQINIIKKGLPYSSIVYESSCEDTTKKYAISYLATVAVTVATWPISHVY